jgi:uncharacterized protein (DUF1800 family)
MTKENLWALRMGFSTKQSQTLEELGIEVFLNQSFSSQYNKTMPIFLENSPRTLKELKALKKLRKEKPEQSKEILKQEIQTFTELKVWWINQMIDTDYPLREKMTLFWHNHFVTSAQKVKVNYWLYQNNQLYREEAFGNFKTITKKVLQTNAMVRYLDNNDNKKGNLNENLSRELLELFTIGIGNYTEIDIKNGAKGLAGLGIGNENAVYRKIFEDNTSFEYLGKKGVLKLDEMIDAIFEHPNIPYLLTKKILQWFIYDHPTNELIHYYGDYFRTVNFEIKPLLVKIFTEEFYKNDTAGSKIKNPLEYSLQVLNELHLDKSNSTTLPFFLKQQGMDLFNQPNVKGWEGGNNWLTSQIYLQRNNLATLFCNGRSFKNNLPSSAFKVQKIILEWNNTGDNKAIIKELTDRLLFISDESLEKDFEKILKYDFNPKSEGSHFAVLRLFNSIVKTPEFQLI